MNAPKNSLNKPWTPMWVLVLSLAMCSFSTELFAQSQKIPWSEQGDGLRFIELDRETISAQNSNYYKAGQRPADLTQQLQQICKRNVARVVERFKEKLESSFSRVLPRYDSYIYFSDYLAKFKITQTGSEPITGSSILEYNCRKILIRGFSKPLQTIDDSYTPPPTTRILPFFVMKFESEKVLRYYDVIPAMDIVLQCQERSLREKMIYAGARNCERSPNASCTPEFFREAEISANTTYSLEATEDSMCQFNSGN